MNLTIPVNNDQPFIAYGTFKPFELRYNLIKDYVEDYKLINLEGLMQEKDGIPIFNFCNRGYFRFTYEAYILNFKKGRALDAYKIIALNEPDTYYQWTNVDSKNILVGRNGLKGMTPFTDLSWTFRNDPYFEHGINACKSIINYNATQDNESQLYRDYLPFFNGSAAYMLLWTIIERFCTLKYGNLSPSDKLKCLITDSDIDWISILSDIERTDIIYRSDKTDYSVKLDSLKGPKKVMEYYYAIRSNMVHRGKDVFDDATRIQNSFFELEKIFQTILSMHNYSTSSQKGTSDSIK